MNCPICKSESVHLNSSLYDDRYGYQGIFQLLRCIDCGHRFLQAKFSPEQLRDLYSNYYPRSSFDLDNYKPYRELQGFNAWLDGYQSSPFRWIPKDVRILDIGCGFGESLGYHQARGCEVYGVEADENIRRVADKFGFNVHVGLFDSAIYQENFFDYVTMSQVIEHVTEPVQTMSGIAKILKPGGVAILSTPNVCGWGARLFSRRWINWHAPYHLHFFTLKSMQLAAQNAGLVLERTVTITPSAWLHFQWIHFFTCPPEGKPSVFWVPGSQWSFTQKVLLRALLILHRSKINHLVTRLFDASGLGDNRLYFLRKP
jgi:2-polyprenyl-3-methyl-5-hydroxy-6-metoxy-1,4-benzoquinol methylase